MTSRYARDPIVLSDLDASKHTVSSAPAEKDAGHLVEVRRALCSELDRAASCEGSCNPPQRSSVPLKPGPLKPGPLKPSCLKLPSQPALPLPGTQTPSSQSLSLIERLLVRAAALHLKILWAPHSGPLKPGLLKPFCMMLPSEPALPPPGTQTTSSRQVGWWEPAASSLH